VNHRKHSAVTDASRLRSDPILIRIGPMQEKYYIHEKLLRSNAGFFDTALKKEWKEGEDRVVDMPEADDEAFGICVNWLYTGLVFSRKEGDMIMNDGVRIRNKEWPRCSACYALGDFLQDPDFKDALVDTIIEAMIDSCLLPKCLFLKIYRYSTKTSCHRIFAVDVFVHCLSRESWGHPKNDQNLEFLTDVLKNVGPTLQKGLSCVTTQEFLDATKTCQYHDHGSDKPCYRIKPAFQF
jgi:hypothetical protein